MWKANNKYIALDGHTVFENINSEIQCINSNYGAFIQFSEEMSRAENTYSLGQIKSVNRLLCCYRNNPLFMSVQFGNELSVVKPETLCLLIEKNDGRYLLLLPVFDSNSRGALQYDNGELQLVGFTGSVNKKTDSGKLLYICEGENPYIMMDNAVTDIKNELKSFGLRKEKPIPEFLKYLGWCTWNSFYFDVDEEKYLRGLDEFKNGEVQLGVTIIDDGWLSTDDKTPIGARILQKFEENRQKFPRGFSYISEKAKKEYGIKDFMVWHASMGYWAGCDIDKYSGNCTYLNYPSSLTVSADDMNKQFFHHPVNPEMAEEFYDDFHKYLKTVGVDGVKIDVQYLIEAVEGYVGNRFNCFNMYHYAKEKSIKNNFGCNALNCMSCSNDMIYRMKYSNALRTGADYNPDVDNSFLIVSNAYNAYWVSQIAYADWDMFYSNKDDSYIEAIARIAGGSPIYVSDELGGHNFELLRKLGLSDGRVLRPIEVGRPTLDCLMSDPFKAGNVLKVFNKNICSYVIGIFNFTAEAIIAKYSPLDIEGITDEEFIAFGYFDKKICRLNCKKAKNLQMSSKTADLITVSPLINGAAIIGLKDKINRSAAVEAFAFDGKNMKLTVISKGEYEIYCEVKPNSIFVNSKEVSFEYQNKILNFHIEWEC